MTFFKHPSQEFVYTRTYSRWIESLQRRETWAETVERYVNFIKDERGDKIPAKVLKKIHEGILHMKVMPSMRALWTAGPAAKRDNTSMYNCSYLEVDNPSAFSEGLFLLMCGAGLGFGVKKDSVSKLPEVPIHITNQHVRFYNVEDSKEGWANSVKDLVNSLYSGNDLDINYNNIRPSGAKLKTFGGTSSGPAPLAKLHEFIRQTFYAAKGRKLTSLECHDIMNELAIAVIAGNVRRSAEISLSDLDDIEMREAKLGEFPNRRWMANNSAIYDTKPNSSQFLKEWASLAESGTGERGIFNLGTAKKTAPKRRNAELLFGTNPCFYKETLIPTSEGLIPIEHLVGKSVTVYSNNKLVEVSNFRVTGENQELLKVTLYDGSEIKITPEHTFILDNGDRVKARDLEIGQKLLISEIESHGKHKTNGAYLKGFLIGDGTKINDRPLLFLYSSKYMCQDRLILSANEIPNGKLNTNVESTLSFKEWNNRKYFSGLAPKKLDLIEWCTSYKEKLPDEVYVWDVETKTEFLAGVFDSDGTASDTKNGFMYQLSSIHKQFLLDIQNLLKSFKIRSSIRLNRKEGLKNFNDGYGDYATKDCYRLTISQKSSIQFSRLVKFSRLKSFENKTVLNNHISRFNKIVNIENIGMAEKVYCCTIPETHSISISNGVEVGQCGEITLRNKGLCNLSEVVITLEDDLDSLLEKIETATWIGAIQSTFTHFPYLSKQWEENANEERLLGVSLTGQMDNPKLMTPDNLKALKSRALKIAKKAADILEVNFSVSVTCVKPSGTVSALVNSASGLHPRFDHYYIRRYRISSLDPLFALIKDQGIELSPENGQSKEDWTTKNPAICHIYDGGEWSEDKVNTWVLKFPMAAPKGAILARDVSAIEQLEYYKMVQTNYCEHNASITVYVKEDEWLKVGSWVYDNWDSVVGISFLPYSDHAYKQAPYESITKEQYEELMANFKEIDYSQLSKYEVVDNTSGARTFACVGGGCDV